MSQPDNLRVPPELQGVRPAVLKDFVHNYVTTYAELFTQYILRSIPNGVVPLEILQRAAADALAALPAPASDLAAAEPRQLKLVYRHSCMSLGCLDPQCPLCEHNPSRRCVQNFERKYLVNDQLKAKCGSSITVEIVDAVTEQPLEDGELPSDMKLELFILDGNMYDAKFPEGPASGEGGGPEVMEDLEACALMLNKKKNTALLSCGLGGINDPQGRVIIPFTNGRATLSDVFVTDSSEAILSGRKPPFRLLARAGLSASNSKSPQGRQLLRSIRHAVSEGFVVATRRTRTAYKLDIPCVDDHVSKLEHMGKETVKKLADISTAAVQAGLNINVPENCVCKVGEFKALALRAEQDGLLRQQLQNLLKLSKEKWEEARDHAMRAVVADNRMRAWYADRKAMDVGLLFACRMGALDLDKPVALLQAHACKPSQQQHDRTGTSGDAADEDPQLEAIPNAAQSPAQRELARQLLTQAQQSWWAPGHSGWAIFPMDTDAFLQTGAHATAPEDWALAGALAAAMQPLQTPPPPPALPPLLPNTANPAIRPSTWAPPALPMTFPQPSQTQSAGPSLASGGSRFTQSAGAAGMPPPAITAGRNSGSGSGSAGPAATPARPMALPSPGAAAVTAPPLTPVSCPLPPRSNPPAPLQLLFPDLGEVLGPIPGLAQPPPLPPAAAPPAPPGRPRSGSNITGSFGAAGAARAANPFGNAAAGGLQELLAAVMPAAAAAALGAPPAGGAAAPSAGGAPHQGKRSAQELECTSPREPQTQRRGSLAAARAAAEQQQQQQQQQQQGPNSYQSAPGAAGVVALDPSSQEPNPFLSIQTRADRSGSGADPWASLTTQPAAQQHVAAAAAAAAAAAQAEQAAASVVASHAAGSRRASSPAAAPPLAAQQQAPSPPAATAFTVDRYSAGMLRTPQAGDLGTGPFCSPAAGGAMAALKDLSSMPMSLASSEELAAVLLDHMETSLTGPNSLVVPPGWLDSYSPRAAVALGAAAPGGATAMGADGPGGMFSPGAFGGVADAAVIATISSSGSRGDARSTGMQPDGSAFAKIASGGDAGAFLGLGGQQLKALHPHLMHSASESPRASGAAGSGQLQATASGLDTMQSIEQALPGIEQLYAEQLARTAALVSGQSGWQ